MKEKWIKFNTPDGTIHVPGVNIKSKIVNGERFYLVDEDKLKEIVSGLYMDIQKQKSKLEKLHEESVKLRRELNSLRDKPVIIPPTARNSEDFK